MEIPDGKIMSCYGISLFRSFRYKKNEYKIYEEIVHNYYATSRVSQVPTDIIYKQARNNKGRLLVALCNW